MSAVDSGRERELGIDELAVWDLSAQQAAVGVSLLRYRREEVTPAGFELILCTGWEASPGFAGIQSELLTRLRVVAVCRVLGLLPSWP